MPIIMAAIWGLVRGGIGLLIRYAGPMIVQALIFFGLSLFGTKFVTTPLLNLIKSYLAGAPAMAIAAFGAIGFDQCITIILSAYVTAAASRITLRKRVTP